MSTDTSNDLALVRFIPNNQRHAPRCASIHQHLRGADDDRFRDIRIGKRNSFDSCGRRDDDRPADEEMQRLRAFLLGCLLSPELERPSLGCGLAVAGGGVAG